MKRSTTTFVLCGLLIAGGFLRAQGGVATEAKSEQDEQDPKRKARIARLIEIAEEVQKEVEAIRGWKFKKPVKKGVHSAKELRGFLERKLDEEWGGGKLERQQRMLRTLGFIPAGMDLRKTVIDVLMSQVGGFYDPERTAFFMMERAAEMGEFLNRTMIAHELTHALDDQYYALDPRMKKRSKEHDASFAVGAVIEGSATCLMTRWGAQHGKKWMNMAEMQKAMKRETEKAKVLINAPAYFGTLAARYMMGLHFLTKGKGQLVAAQRSVADEVAAAMQKIPVSSEQILHPEKYWDAESIDLPVRLADEKAYEAKLCEHFAAKVVERETLGEIHMALLGRSPKRKLRLELMGNVRSWTNRAAMGWGGDRVWLLDKANAKGRDVAAGEGDQAQAPARGAFWLTAWDTAKDAEEFEAAYSKHYSERTKAKLARHGRLLVIAYGFCADESADGLIALAKAAQLTRGKRPFSAEKVDK